MTLTTEEITEAALCAWMEARSEGLAGCFSVLHVIHNRVVQWGKTVHDVIYGRNQFSWTRPDDPEHDVRPKEDDPVYVGCLYQAPLVFDGADDPTKGATYYTNLKTMQVGGWFDKAIVHGKDFEECAKTQHHTFYRRVGSSASVTHDQ